MTFASLFAVSALNSIWQSALLAGLVGVFLRLRPRTAAAQRYVIWATVLFACVALPVANMLLPARTFALSTQAISAPLPPGAELTSPAHARVRIAGPTLRSTHGTPPVTAPTLLSRLPDLAMGALALWAIVAGFLMLRLAVGYVRLNRVRRTLDERPLDRDELVACARMTSRTVRVGYSNTVSTPCMVGLGEATIVLPDVLSEGITKSDLLRILRHECAHIRRLDDYGNLVQRILCALLFFNPVIYLVSRALDIDREVACDDAVELAEAERVEFAKCLYDIARHNLRRPWMPATGFVRYRSHISLRISQLLDRNHNGSTRIGAASAISVAAILSLVLPLGLMQLRAGAQQAQVAPHRVRAQGASVRRATAQASVMRTVDKETKHEDSGDDFLNAVSAAGFHDLSANDLIEMRNAGVTAECLRAYAAAGLLPMSFRDVIRLENAGVTSDYVSGIRSAGLAGVSVRDLIRLADTGVTPEFIRHIKQSVLASPSIDDLIRLRNAGV